MTLSPAQIHLALNHFPVIAMILALLLGAWALVGASEERRRLALAAIALAGLLAVPAFLTGEPAEEAVEDLPGIEERAIHRHEESAKVALAGHLVAGALALAGLVAFRRRLVPRGFLAASLLVALVATVLVARAAHEGGLIRHPELRPGGVAGSTPWPDD